MQGINYDYVLGVVENNNRLEVVQEPIERSSHLLSELYVMVNDRRKTVLDMQTLFEQTIKVPRRTFYYCLPYYYIARYISDTRAPLISEEQYQKLLKSQMSSLKTGSEEYRSRCANKQLKQKWYEDYFNYLMCYDYYMACKRLESKRNYIMLSSESLGWTEYNYHIDRNFKVNLSTNFCYGNSAYFHLTVKYKNIVVAPYSYIVRYYNANMVQLCSCTRAYDVSRNSWKPAFDFVTDFVNRGKEDPKGFVEKYIKNEVLVMISGLQNIVQNPTETVRVMIDDRKNNFNNPNMLKFVTDMPCEDLVFFNIYPGEFETMFIAEKITCALDVLESLNSLLPIIPEVEDAIKGIKNLNCQIIPKISTMLSSIEPEIKKLQKRYVFYQRKVERLREQKKPFDEKIERKWKRESKKDSSKTKREVEQEFCKRHPELLEIKEKIMKTRSNCSKTGSDLNSRIKIKNRLENCLNKINDFIAKMDK